MNQEQLYSIIKKPHLSEKSTIIAEKNQFVFQVASCANKQEIKAAIEKIFNVKVVSVNISSVKSKAKRFKQMLGSKKAWKKAYVCLEAGNNIDFLSIN